jgi:hypothetical protein
MSAESIVLLHCGLEEALERLGKPDIKLKVSIGVKSVNTKQ